MEKPNTTPAPAYMVYSIGNGQIAVVVRGEKDYHVFDTPKEVRDFLIEIGLTQ